LKHSILSCYSLLQPQVENSRNTHELVSYTNIHALRFCCWDVAKQIIAAILIGVSRGFSTSAGEQFLLITAADGRVYEKAMGLHAQGVNILQQSSGVS